MQRSSIIANRDCIAFEQRGTRFAIPHLRLIELDSSMKVVLHTTFVLPFLDTLTGQTLPVEYTKNELLDLIDVTMQNPNLKDVPFLITEIINGHHEKYIRPRLHRIIYGYPSPDGMRMSVHCADQANYHREEIIKQVYKLYPYMEGYRINDVWKGVCDCLKVPPTNPIIKQPFHSPRPVLIGDGEMDPACRPLYMLQIKHYMPNAQTFLFINRSHGVGGKDWYQMTQQFLDNPSQKIEPANPNVIPY